MLTKSEKAMAIISWGLILFTPIVMYFTIGI